MTQEEFSKLAAEISAMPEPDPALIRLHDPASDRFYSPKGFDFGPRDHSSSSPKKDVRPVHN